MVVFWAAAIYFFLSFRMHGINLQDQSAHQERDRGTDGDTGQDLEILARRDDRKIRNDRAWGGGRHQAGATDHEPEISREAASDHREDHNWVSQDIWEIDFVDATQEVDDHGAGRRLLEHALAGQRERAEQAKPGAGVALEQEMDGVPSFLGCNHAKRRQHTVIEGIVKEQYLGRLDNDGGEGKQPSPD